MTAGLCLVSIGGILNAATDPGPRPGAIDAGNPIPGLTPDQLNAFNIAKETFNAFDSVDGSVPGEDDEGLGPTFNGNSCAGCHAFPASGGTSPRTNPQIALATLHGARNTVPSFLSANGPIREVRFKRNADGTPDGGVHSLFVITGRPDAPPGFNLPQTNFAAQVAANNLVFRIPTPVFGLGLVEAVTDRNIMQAAGNNTALKTQLGISGHPNFNGNDGTIARFGWKAQNKSLMIFAGEAYNVEQGVTNDLFPNAREIGDQTLIDGQPESTVDLATGGIADAEQFTIFMRLLDAPKRRNPPGVSNASVAAGRSTFDSIGCVLCHTANLRAGTASVSAITNRVVPLFSDLLVHNMGAGLADEVSQGGASGDEFRTAPLWGTGQRIFFLHDGRTTDLQAAILAHQSAASGAFPVSEANAVIQRFTALPDNQKQDLLNFLRSL